MHQPGTPITLGWPLLVWAGFVAAVIVAWLLEAVRMAGMDLPDPARFLGCFFRSDPDAWTTRAVGVVGYGVLAAGLVPILYALAFEWLGHADLMVGAGVGAVHATVSGGLLALLGHRNQCVRNGTFPEPGAFGRRWGPRVVTTLVLTHLTYGGLLGYIYVVPGE